MQIVHYPHPTLRFKSKPIKRVDSKLRDIVGQMFELMYEAKGIGLAANQVDLPLRLFIVNTASDPQEGEEHIFLNPVLSRPKGNDEKEEGCLSLPGLNGLVRRPETVVLNAFTLDGKEINQRLDGMMARVVQHEIDHLDGVLFIDRLSTTGKLEARESIEGFELEFKAKRESQAIPQDDEIMARLSEWERKYCW